jgi:hypothetical protein
MAPNEHELHDGSSSAVATVPTLDVAAAVQTISGSSGASVWLVGEVRTSAIRRSDPVPGFIGHNVELVTLASAGLRIWCRRAEDLWLRVYGRPETRRARARIP